MSLDHDGQDGHDGRGGRWSGQGVEAALLPRDRLLKAAVARREHEGVRAEFASLLHVQMQPDASS